MNVLKNSSFCLGPMSSVIVDAIIDFSEKTGTYFTLIPSRRQVEYDGGYVNNWSSFEFSKYINSKYLTIQRDHGGPLQGKEEDDGLISLKQDCLLFSAIHIDPWKAYPDIKEGTQKTIDLIRYCYSLNPKIFFEVGTEEAIRHFSSEDLHYLLNQLKINLTPEQFNQIIYCVIQSGTGLKNGINTGSFDATKLTEMCSIVNSFNLLSKEHNGDFMNDKDMQSRFKNGLTSINIAPELGIIQTKTILEYYKDNTLFLDNFYKICYDSKKWIKWVSEDFDPIQNKQMLMEITGHYVFTHPDLRDIFYNNTELINKIHENIRHFLVRIIENKSTA